MKRFLTKRNALILLSVLFFLIAWNREINLLYSMFSLVAATLIISLVLPRYSLHGITVSRDLPAAAFEGDEITLRLRVGNNGRTSRYMIEVEDFIPAAEEGLQLPMAFVAKIAGAKIRDYAIPVVCYKRGDYSVGPLTIRSAYPLGVSSIERKSVGDAVSLVVYPEVFEIASLPVLSGGALLSSGLDALSKAGGNEDFFGTREYRRGDSLRYIHWPSSARHAQLVVKEFEVRASTDVTILPDLQRGSDVGRGRETTLEYSVRIAASISKYVLERGHNLQLIGYGRDTHIISYARGLGHMARILDVLARVRADGSIPYPLSIMRAADHMKDGGTVVLLFHRLDPAVDDCIFAISLLKAKRIRPICVFLDRESFMSGRKSREAASNPVIQEFIGAGAPVYLISKGDNLRETFSI